MSRARTASQGFNENAKKDASSAQENRNTNASFSSFFQPFSLFASKSRAAAPNDDTTKPRYTVVKDLEGPVQWDDDFLLDL